MVDRHERMRVRTEKIVQTRSDTAGSRAAHAERFGQADELDGGP